MTKIAKECGVDRNTIAKWIKIHKIHKRTHCEEGMLAKDRTVNRASCNANITYRSKKWLEEQRIGKGLTLQAMAELCDAGHSTISKWLRLYGLNSRRVIRGRTSVVLSFTIPMFMEKKLIEFCEMKKMRRSELIRSLLIEAMMKEGFDPYAN